MEHLEIINSYWEKFAQTREGGPYAVVHEAKRLMMHYFIKIRENPFGDRKSKSSMRIDAIERWNPLGLRATAGKEESVWAFTNKTVEGVFRAAVKEAFGEDFYIKHQHRTLLTTSLVVRPPIGVNPPPNPCGPSPWGGQQPEDSAIICPEGGIAVDLTQCEILPHPSTDPFPDLTGEARQSALRGLAERVCEFLKSEEGLLAIPGKPRFFSVPSEFTFSVGEKIALERLGLPGIKRISVSYPVSAKYCKSPSLEDPLDFKPLHAYLLIGLGEVREGPSSRPQPTPFFSQLACHLGVAVGDLVLAYGVDWDPGLVG